MAMLSILYLADFIVTYLVTSTDGEYAASSYAQFVKSPVNHNKI